ncbi:hypothetical protein [Thalassobaculum sp.]|uniref:hypothetical protein n=1 Tax=Thalassobaculum sp. TaxID=2022740 RepID=UPI0032F06746
MAWSVTLAGETFTDANVAGTAYADEATGFPAILAAFAREAAFLQGLAATSSTPATPAVGALVLTTHQDAAEVGLSPGMLVRIVSAGDPARLMIATVTGFSGTTLGLQVQFASGPAAADWVITRPHGGVSVALDPAPALAADLDAAGRSILGAADATLSGDLAVAGRASLGGAGESRVGYLGEVSGVLLIGPSDPTSLVCTLVGDTTFLVAGADTPGYEHAHRIRATVGGAGGWNVTVLPASRLTYSNDLSPASIDSGWARGDLAPVQDVATPAGPGWTLAASGTGPVQHYLSARRPPNAEPPYAYVAATLLKAGASQRARFRLVVDTYAKGGYLDLDLAAGSILAGAGLNGGAVLGSGIRALGDGWHLVWLVADVAVGGVPLTTTLNLLDATGADTFVQAGESILFGGATLGAGTDYQGFQHVGTTRTDAVLWQGQPVTWPALPAGQTVDLMIQCDPDRIIQQDYTPEEI